MAHNYIIRVTAGTTRDVTEHKLVAVNTAEPLKIESDLIEARVNVRVKNYHGLPRNSPVDSPYFAAEPHAYNDDQYSIAINFKLKQPPEGKVGKEADSKENDDDAAPADDEDRDLGVKGGDLQWGNDFDHPIRDRLPPGFNTALNIVRWWIDPGLEGDAYADSPYLYGPALSSFNQVRVGPPSSDRVPQGKGADVEGKEVGLWIEEGANDEAGFESRRSTGAPDDAKARMKWALKADSKEKWVWEYGKEYSTDFFNPYIDFKEFALRLPGFHLPIMKYWDGQGARPPKRSHTLRYVLRNRKTGDLYLAVTFSLYLKEDVNEDGSLKPGTVEAQKKDSRTRKAPTHEDDHGKHDDNEPHDEDKSIEEARKKFGDIKVDDASRPDDVD
ncbi:uncharacterized protein PgNI_01415 [Pyricularia grisea]|uniref:Domain of unknown function at the cortex 1 domain-containing protein n=1 Tax=Pyricularia grisea TaxID=148305 RepID=A0A6P8BG12_PYRGI|nr:uncharacterized protein PgNI_01415 [Pyricularia grisea]TLD15796.1 hypothetical protein PgNI_01415 [Pyricularia grisea]